MKLHERKLILIENERKILLREISIMQARVVELNTQRQNIIMR